MTVPAGTSKAVMIGNVLIGSTSQLLCWRDGTTFYVLYVDRKSGGGGGGVVPLSTA